MGFTLDFLSKNGFYESNRLPRFSQTLTTSFVCTIAKNNCKQVNVTKMAVL